MPDCPTRYLCECKSFECSLSISYKHMDPQDVAKPGHAVILKGCLHGPESTDVLIADKGLYSVYKDGSR
jgi:hypothetical protein